MIQPSFETRSNGKDAYQDYRELIQQALGSGKVAALQAEVVYEEDNFVYEPGKPVGGIDHKPVIRGERGEMIGVYCITRFSNGLEHYVWLPKDEVLEQHKALSKNGDNWDKHPQAYWKKTAVHVAAKWWPSINGLPVVLAPLPLTPTVDTGGASAAPPEAPSRPAVDPVEVRAGESEVTAVGQKADGGECNVSILATSNGQQDTTANGKNVTNFYGKIPGEGGEGSRFTIWEHVEVISGMVVWARSVTDKGRYQGEQQYWVSGPQLEATVAETSNGGRTSASDIPF